MNLGKLIADLFNVDCNISDKHWEQMDNETRRLFIKDVMHAAGLTLSKSTIINICNNPKIKPDKKIEQIKLLLS